MSGSGVVTAPLPVARVCNKTSSNRIQNDVTCDFEKVTVSINHESFKTTLKKVANALVNGVEPLRVVAVHVAHERGEVAFRGLDEQVVVIAHEDVGVENRIVKSETIGEVFQEGETVSVVEKDFLSSVASSGDVIKCAFEFDAKRSCHMGRL